MVKKLFCKIYILYVIEIINFRNECCWVSFDLFFNSLCSKIIFKIISTTSRKSRHPSKPILKPYLPHLVKNYSTSLSQAIRRSSSLESLTQFFFHFYIRKQYKVKLSKFWTIRRVLKQFQPFSPQVASVGFYEVSLMKKWRVHS